MIGMGFSHTPPLPSGGRGNITRDLPKAPLRVAIRPRGLLTNDETRAGGPGFYRSHLKGCAAPMLLLARRATNTAAFVSDPALVASNSRRRGLRLVDLGLRWFLVASALRGRDGLVGAGVARNEARRRKRKLWAPITAVWVVTLWAAGRLAVVEVRSFANHRLKQHQVFNVVKRASQVSVQRDFIELRLRLVVPTVEALRDIPEKST